MTRFIALVLTALTALPLRAETPSDYVDVSIVPGWRTAEGTHLAGVRIALAPGWHTYWRAPGDAGIPPAFDWTGSENISAARFHWPIPEVFVQNGMRSIGYEGEVVIPVELSLADPDAAVQMAGRLQIGICHEICMPVDVVFDADLPAGGGRDTALVAALVDQPLSAEAAGVASVGCAVAPIADGLAVTARIEMPPLGGAEAVVIEVGDPGVWVSEPVAARSAGVITAQADMVPLSGGAFALDRSAVRITVIADGQAVDIRGCGN